MAELAPQQNVIAVVLDDSRSMAIADSGSDGKRPREAAAQKALEDGVLAGLQKKFQARLYRLDSRVAQAAALKDIQPAAPATHLNDSLRQLATDTSDLPIGAVVLLSDGSENSPETWRSRPSTRCAIAACPFIPSASAKSRPAHDVELNDVSVATRAMADSRIPATVTFHQRGYAGSKALLLVRDGDKTVGSREITFGADGTTQVETVFFVCGRRWGQEPAFPARPAAWRRKSRPTTQSLACWA